jgi:hypothetical protein
MNYDTTVVGKPYARMPDVRISTPAPGMGNPAVQVEQELGIKLFDGTYAVLPDKPPAFRVEFDLVQHGNDTVPLVDNATGAAIPAGHATLQGIANAILAGVVTPNIAMLVILAVLRNEQVKVNG